MRIWKIGLGKTGTTSLHYALAKLGYRSCHIHKFCDIAVASLVTGREDHWSLQAYDAFTDGEMPAKYYPLLYEIDPTAKFILTTRNVEDWIDSNIVRVLYHRVRATDAHKGPYSINTDRWREAFHQHHAAVQQFFADKPEALLVFNCCDGNDGYAELCEFLKKPLVNAAWPRQNTSDTKIDDIQIRLAARCGKR